MASVLRETFAGKAIDEHSFNLLTICEGGTNCVVGAVFSESDDRNIVLHGNHPQEVEVGCNAEVGLRAGEVSFDLEQIINDEYAQQVSVLADEAFYEGANMFIGRCRLIIST